MARKSQLKPEDWRDVVKPKVKDVVAILGMAAAVGACLVVPAAPRVLIPIYKYLDKKGEEAEERANTKFDKVRLWVVLRRLEKSSQVKIERLSDGTAEVTLTDKGKLKKLRFDLDDLAANFHKRDWDGRWRIIIFDIPEKKRSRRDAFRQFLNRLRFYQLQKSVYLTAYPCENEIEYLRRVYELGDNVQILVVQTIENDSAYRLYFGLS